jgi:general secretion pathway protein A
MYLSYYGLARSPFEAGPEPDPFFETPDHLDALSGLIYGITENRGFISITGASGVGKTTTLYAAVQSLGLTHPDLAWIEVDDPARAPEDLLTRLIDTLNLPTALTPEGDLGPVRNRLLRLREAGRSLVLVFDQAQDLNPELLRFLERLAALSDDESPLFTAVFVGLPAWDALLRRPEHRELDRRVAVRVAIAPLTPRLARDYVDFRIAAAGGSLSDVMDARAVRTLVAGCDGNAARIHALASRALELGRGKRHKPLTAADVRAALREVDPKALDPQGTTGLRLVALVIIVFLIGSVSAFWVARYQLAPRQHSPTAATAPVTAKPPKPATP